MDRRIKKTNTAIFRAYIRAKKLNPETEPSVKEICAIADINKTTFYRYFTDIDSLSSAVINAAANKLLIDGIDVKQLFTAPEIYFGHVLENLKSNGDTINALLADNPYKFVYEAEKMLKAELKRTVPESYDEVLCTFIAGGATHYFLSANYNDKTEMQKLCKIMKAATLALK